MTQSIDGKQLTDGSIDAAKLAVGAVAQLLVGDVPPTTEGVDGDFYMDSAGGLMYGPKAAGVWPEGFALGGGVLGFNATDRDVGGRFRVSAPNSLFDSKMLYNKEPLVWDEQITGAGVTSVHSVDRACVDMSVSNGVAGKVIRQTFQHFNYQSGKTQQIQLSALPATGIGIKCEAGYYNGSNGILFRSEDNVVSIVKSSTTSGSVVETIVTQDAWNIDTMDGSADANNPSGLMLDTSKVELVSIEFEWFGVAAVRMAIQIDGANYLVHQFNHANLISTVFMSTPNLPLRYSLENKGTGPAVTMQHICSTVISEGGHNPEGILGAVRSAADVIGLVQGTKYALIGIRLKATEISATINLEQVTALLASNNDRAYWEIIHNPTVAGTFNYVDQPNSSVQTAVATDNTNTVTGGRVAQGGFLTSGQSLFALLRNALHLGVTIGGTPQTAVLCITPFTGTLDVAAGLTWRQIR